MQEMYTMEPTSEEQMADRHVVASEQNWRHPQGETGSETVFEEQPDS